MPKCIICCKEKRELGSDVAAAVGNNFCDPVYCTGFSLPCLPEGWVREKSYSCSYYFRFKDSNIYVDCGCNNNYGDLFIIDEFIKNPDKEVTNSYFYLIFKIRSKSTITKDDISILNSIVDEIIRAKNAHMALFFFRLISVDLKIEMNIRHEFVKRLATIVKEYFVNNPQSPDISLIDEEAKNTFLKI